MVNNVRECEPSPVFAPLEDGERLMGRLAAQVADVSVDGADENENDEREQ